MTEPVMTPAAVYTFGGAMAAGHFLGMPVDAVALGAVASAAVTMISEPKSRWLVVAYTLIGGLLGGAFAPTLGHMFADAFGGDYRSLSEQRVQLAQVFAPVLVGLLWQGVLRFVCAVYPHFESRADDLVDWLFGLLPFKNKGDK